MSAEKFIVVNNQKRTFTYTVGNPISISLEAAKGKAPYAWSYLSLPTGLTGTKDGKVTGVLDSIGYYSFSATANDAEGNSADCYYTFNVQPANIARIIFVI